MSKQSILVADSISPKGIEELQADSAFEVEVNTSITAEELVASAEKYHAIIVRSRTQITEEVLEKASNLRVVGRAGVGVDNIKIDASLVCNIGINTATIILINHYQPRYLFRLL